MAKARPLQRSTMEDQLIAVLLFYLLRKPACVWSQVDLWITQIKE